MEQFKFDFFKKEHSSQTMNVVTLSKAECDKVFASFCSAYNMEKQERNQVFDIIQDKGIPVNFTNAEDKNFDLSCLISENCKRQLPTHLYVCWDYFYAIDRFDFNDIVKYFSDIWYPSVDDIIIFDDSYKVCMMIRHDGVIYLLNKKPQKQETNTTFWVLIVVFSRVTNFELTWKQQDVLLLKYSSENIRKTTKIRYVSVTKMLLYMPT